MTDSTGTAVPGDDDAADDAYDDDADLEAADAVPAGALAAGSGSAVSRGAVSGSTAVTPRGRRGPVTRVKGIGTFYRQVVAELRKVIWPTRNELVTYTTVVVVFVVVMVTIVSIFDFAFSQAVLKVFGDSSL